MPVPQTFISAFEKYIENARTARAAEHSERQRSALFLSFVGEAFGVETHDIVLEQRIYIGTVRRLGYIDALFGDLVFEFKRRLNSEQIRNPEQLQNYLLSLQDGERYVGLMTDCLQFEAYVLEGNRVRHIDSFNLETADAESAFVRLDAYLFSQKNVAPTSADIVQRFGGSSPTFQAAFRTMQDLLKQVEKLPVLAVSRDQWRRLLSKVYGSDIGDDNLFLRHTFLCQFARLLAYATLRGIPANDSLVAQIIDGSAFYGQGVSNIAEQDFFAWVLIPQIKQQAVTMFRRLAEGLVVYDLTRIDQDLLKQLYQDLVDPVTRHDLGEFYTPDWLAELTLSDIDYQHPQSLLDPACGSGTFLFSTIKRLAAQGLTGWSLVNFAVDNVVGMDVHPLAVTVARINYLLALAEHLREPNPQGGSDLMTIPVYMADALIRPLENESQDALAVPVDEKHHETFRIPFESALSPQALSDTIDAMYNLARRTGDPKLIEPHVKAFHQQVRRHFGADLPEVATNHWISNLRLLTKLIHEERNSIWAYILKNTSRPLVLARRQFDVIAGNPPWLSYRYIRSAAYQRQVKLLYQYYKLIDSDDVKLFTQMDLSTLFFAHARDRYLKPGGTLAFVMPRSVITGAKQHRPFQQQGFTRVIDLLGVFPLFNVPTCVLIRQGENIAKDNALPSAHYTGRLKAHEISWEQAEADLKSSSETVRFVDSDVRSPHYYEQFNQGATLVPRNLCFVRPEGLASSPAVVSDEEVNLEAKVPWKGISLRGVVEDDYIYATLLSKFLMPFGYEKLHLVALPVSADEDGRLCMLENEMDFASRGHFNSYDWFKQASDMWDKRKKDTSKLTFQDQLNYRNKITMQSQGEIKVIYNGSGVHLAAFVIDTRDVTYSVYGRRAQGFIVDYKCYFCNAASLEEAHYLCALLNAPYVDDAIKDYQSRGKGFVGQRDISRTPFEACAIPPFDAAHADHLALARLSQQAHAEIELLKTSGALKGGVVAKRRKARETVDAQIAAIDVIARRLLGL